MGLFAINTKSANTGFTSLTTSAVSGTYTQLPSQLCDEVEIYVPGANPVTIAGSSSPGNALLQLAAGSIALLKTGGNLSNLWAAPTTAAAVSLGLYWIAYKPIT